MIEVNVFVCRSRSWLWVSFVSKELSRLRTNNHRDTAYTGRRSVAATVTTRQTQTMLYNSHKDRVWSHCIWHNHLEKLARLRQRRYTVLTYLGAHSTSDVIHHHRHRSLIVHLLQRSCKNTGELHQGLSKRMTEKAKTHESIIKYRDKIRWKFIKASAECQKAISKDGSQYSRDAVTVHVV